jgi:hypothetical protein
VGWLLLAAPLLVAVFGVIWLVAGVGHVARGRAGKGGRGLLGGTTLAAVGLALSLVGINAQSFARLTHEGPVAEVTIKAIPPADDNLYSVAIRRLDGSFPVQFCQIQGDEWLITGRVQKWKPWANAIGLDATYSLNEITNKYRTAERGNGKTITACDIAGPAPVVNQYMPDWMVQWLIGHAYVEDRRFGDANYMPLADGATYRVVITQMGFNTEPENDAARAANDAER